MIRYKSGEVIGQWLRYSKSLDEIEEDLKDILWREIDIMYTDNERALGKGSSVIKYSRKCQGCFGRKYFASK